MPKILFLAINVNPKIFTMYSLSTAIQWTGALQSYVQNQ